MAMASLPSLGSQPSSMDLDINPDDSDQGFDEMFVPPPPDVYECPICLLVLNQPMQTVCGHRFCKGCILRVLREGRPNCPIDNERLNESQVYPDNFARREISCLNVRCRNYQTHGCDWIGNMKSLKTHLSTCEHGVISCPNGCGQQLPRMEMDAHVADRCERRIVCCEFCDIKVVYKVFNEHRDRCMRFPVDCPNACPTGKIAREELPQHLENYCPNTIIKCSFKEFGCTFEGTREEIRRHDESSDPIHFEYMSKTIRSLKKTQDQHGQSLQRQTEGERLTNRILELELVVDKMRQLNTELERKLDNLAQSTKDNEKMIQEVNARVWSGCIIWKITNFRELYQQAKSGETPALHSFPFYTAVPGYKMCIRVNLNGIDSGAHTHVSMFVHLMQGEFDSIVPWPFSGSINLTIMDQDAFPGEPQHVREILTARPSLQAFLRPKLSRNQKGYGYVEMISHAMLESRGYIKDDSILVKVEVKMTNR